MSTVTTLDPAKLSNINEAVNKSNIKVNAGTGLKERCVKAWENLKSKATDAGITTTNVAIGLAAAGVVVGLGALAYSASQSPVFANPEWFNSIDCLIGKIGRNTLAASAATLIASIAANTKLVKLANKNMETNAKTSLGTSGREN
jgi:hypothetical protein